jgi:hypothetical protein
MINDFVFYRLEAYDRNQDFRGEVVILPEPLDPDWPGDGFHQLQLEHQIHLPKLTKEQIDGYFKYRMADDNEQISDLKALQKGKKMYESQKIYACSINVKAPSIFFTGFVGAAMRKKLMYNYKIRIDKDNGEVLNSHCECPSGKGPHGTCKHIAAVLYMLHDFVQSGSDPKVQQSCTEMLQTFHKPKKQYAGTPVKAKDIPNTSRKCKLTDPRPPEYRNIEGYEDHVRSTVLNYCANTSKDITMKYMWERADLQAAANDHNYMDLPVTEHWVYNSYVCSDSTIKELEKKTRKQADCKRWKEERLWRITASRFGEVCKLTARRNMNKLCNSFMKTSRLCNKAIIHGKQYESKGLKVFQSKSGLNVQKCGLFIFNERPYIAASPDGLIGSDALVEIKCPYTGRDNMIAPGKLFPYLEYRDGEIELKQTSNYYYQVQGQLYICKRQWCYFIVYTFKDILIRKIMIDKEYCEHSLLPKLEVFYEKYLRKYIAAQL